MKIYNLIKKLAPICAVFAALAFTSCKEEPAEDTGTDTPPPAAEEGAADDAKGTE